MKLKRIFEALRRFIKPMPKRDVTWTEFVVWLQGKTVKEKNEDNGTTWLTFTDGSRATLECEIEPGYDISEVTPGPGDTVLPTLITVEEPEES